MSGIASGHLALCQGLVGGFYKENCGSVGARESGKNGGGEGRQPVEEMWVGCGVGLQRGARATLQYDMYRLRQLDRLEFYPEYLRTI